MNKIVFGGELRANQESRTIEGKAISFETESNYIGFIEVLHRGCITQETIDKSNIVFTYNHQRDQILARRKNGQGNLDIELREDGVYFSFEVPNTTLGNDVLENIRCGNISQCSFAFTYGTNAGSFERSYKDGVKYVDVYEIEELFDLSAVVDPAYEDTYIKARSAEWEEEVSEVNNDVETQVVDEPENPEINNNEESIVETVETPQEENENEEETRSENKNKLNIKKMEKRFSLVNAINNIANNRQLDAVESAICSDGQKEARNSGLSYGGQIQLPVSEFRANVTVAAEGDDVVATDLYDILGPLRAKNVLVQAGAKFLTGLVGDVQIPVMSATNVGWAGEVASASDGAPTFTNVTLSPKRLTAYVNISKQLLTQHSVDVENMIRQDILAAINSKLEETILGDGDGKQGGSEVVAPKGMFNGKTTVKSVTTMAKIADMEATVESANVLGDCKWIVSPKFKATLRDKAKGSNVSESLYVNGEIDGTQALSTGNVGTNLAIYGDFSNLAIAQWGAIDLTVDPYTQAKNGMITLVVNAYFDAKVLRDNAFVYGTTAAS